MLFFVGSGVCQAMDTCTNVCVEWLGWGKASNQDSNKAHWGRGFEPIIPTSEITMFYNIM